MHDFVYLLERFMIFISAPFLELVNISITAGWAVLAVVAVRLLFKKAPKWLSCALWGVVALRLILPISIESIFSLVPSTQTVNPSAFYNDSFEVNTGFSAVDSTVTDIYNSADISAGTGVEIAGIAALVWLVGAVVMAAYAFISFARLKFSLRTATKKEGNIYQSESVSSPFVLGLFRPKIYLPYKMNESDIPLVIAHERAHIKRLDHIIKPLGFLLLSVHWFNPLMWAAYILLCRDIEAACDEKVIRDLGEDCRRSYSTALLNASISRKSIAACPLAFGEVGVRTRIKGVMNYKKPAFWVVIAAVAVCIITAVCFLTNPKEEDKTEYNFSHKIDSELDNLITKNIIEKNQGYYLDGMVSCEAHTVLATQALGENEEDNIAETITVYVVSMYQEYSLENGNLVEKGGNITPLALSFLVEKDISTGKDSYALTEYWEPGMGSQYTKDLQAKFPIGIDYDTQTYVKELEKECIAQAAKYFGIKETDTTEQMTAEMTTVMLEAKSDYELTVTRSKANGVTWMTDETFYKKNGFHAYLYCLDKAYVTIDGKDIYIGDALNSEKLYVDTLLQKAENDVKHGKAKMDMLKDGGTKFYRYNGCTIIKRNTVEGNKDLLITYADISTTEYSAAVKFINESIPKENETTTAAAKKPRLIVNGQEINANGYIEFNQEEQYVMLPLFTIVKALGATVENPTADEVTIKYNGQKYVLKKDKNSLKITTERNDFNYLWKPPGTTHSADNYASGNEFLMYNECLTYFLYKEFNAQLRYDYSTLVVQVKSNNEINGVTADISPEAEPKLTGKVTSTSDNTIYMELTSDQSGIKKGTPVTVRLGSMLSYAPNISTAMLKKGDIVTVIYDGRVMETYPLQIDALAVYKIVM